MSGRRKRGAAWRVLWVVMCAFGCGVTAYGADWAGEDPNVLAANFGIVLESVAVSACSSVRSEAGAVVYARPERKVTISLRYDMDDANKPVAVDGNPPVIVGVFDEMGQEVAFETTRFYGERIHEEVRWKLVSEDKGSVRKLVPSGSSVDLILDPNQPLPSSLSYVEGYVWALYGEDVIETDVPFEITGEWIDAAEDLRICVRPQTPPTPGPIQYEAIPGIPRGAGNLRPSAPVALWKYETCVQSTMGRYMLTLDRPWSHDVSVGDYVLIKTQLIEGDWLVSNVSDQWAYTGINGSCYCSGQVEQSNNDFDSIRHVIAVGPVEVTVPFVLRDVPVPGFGVGAK